MQQLIINADDFGLTDGVCRAIVELGEAKFISSTTAMLGVPGALPRISKFWNQLKVPCGVHLHVTYGAPVSPAMVACCAKYFGGKFPRTKAEIDYPEDLLLEECRAQVELFIKEFGRPDHFDTHHGFHRDLRYRESLLALAAEYGLPMRGDRDGHDTLALKYGVRESHVLESWSNTGWDDVAAGFSKLKDIMAKGLKGEVWELVAHPAYTDDELRAITTLNDRRELERQVLSAPETRAFFQSQGIQLVNFGVFKA